MPIDVSRRTFTKAMAAATTCTLASGSVAMTPAIADDAVDEDATAPIPPVGEPAQWDKEADIVVVGSGGGLAAAAYAASQGAKVILVEKMIEIGGATKEASGMVAPGSVLQEELGMPDLSETLIAATEEAAPFSVHFKAFNRAVVEAEKELVAWTIGEGFAWQPSIFPGAPGPVAICPAGVEEGGMTARAFLSYVNFLADVFEGYGGELNLSTEVLALVTDGDGAVVGVKAEDESGSELYIKAQKGVLLATGGIGNNRDMLRKYIPTAYECCKFSTAGVHDTGEGIRMGLGVGAQIEGFDIYNSFDGGINGVDWNYYMYKAAVQIARQPWLGITRYGGRYPYLVGSAAEYFSSAAQLNKLPGHEGYVFFDAKYPEYGPTFDQNGCRKLISAAIMPDEGRVPEALVDPEWTDGVAYAIEDGLISSADTIAELAEKLGLDPEMVQAEVDAWNALCEAGTDPEGKMPDEFLYPIAEPPYYGMAVGSFLFATHCGLSVNEGGQVLDTQGKVITGLYASGCTVGMAAEPSNSSLALASSSALLAAKTMLQG